MAGRVRRIEAVKAGVINVEDVLTFDKKVRLLAPHMKKRRHKFEKLATRHYQNVTSAVKAQLKHGFSGVRSKGGRTIKTYDGEDKPLSYKTAVFSELSETYIKRSPRSHKIWHKRGTIYGAASAVMPVRRLKVKAIAIRHEKQKGSKKKRKMTSTFTLAFPRIQSTALTSLMAQPFVQGNENAVGNKPDTITRNSVETIWYPERTKRTKGKGGGPVKRPWIAGLSGKLGSRMHQAIRKL